MLAVFSIINRYKMSQVEVLRLLIELGGNAPTIKLREAARKKFPYKSLHHTIDQRLYKLEEKGNIKIIMKNGKKHWQYISNKGFEQWID